MKLNLRTRLTMAFGVTFALALTMAIVLFNRFGAANREARDNYTQGFVDVRLLGDAIIDVGELREHLVLISFADGTFEAQRQADYLSEEIVTIEERIADYKARPQSPETLTLLSEFEEDWAQLKASGETIVDAATTGDFESAKDTFLSETEILTYHAANSLLIAQEIEDNNARERYNTTLSLFRQAQIVGWGLIAATLLTGVALAYWLSKTISVPLAEMSKTSKLMSDGDLGQIVKIPPRPYDEISILAEAFNQMARDVESRQKALQDLNQTLEQRVNDRTKALQEARDEALAAQRIANENSRLKSEFLSTMSHELRTPLNAIEGFTSIMLGGMGIELSPRAEDMVKRVSSNSKRLLHLINDFLDLSRIESGRLELINEPLSIERLAHKWENEVGVLAEEKNLAFSVNVDDELPPIILGDEDALSKIAINLLSNAFKFTQEGQVKLDIERSEAVCVKDFETTS